MSADRTNRWLAERGYATWRRVIDQEIEPELRGTSSRTLAHAQPCVQHAWEAAAAAIRRRVVSWKLPAEEEPLCPNPNAAAPTNTP
jgi:hypothetical protein